MPKTGRKSTRGESLLNHSFHHIPDDGELVFFVAVSLNHHENPDHDEANSDHRRRKKLKTPMGKCNAAVITVSMALMIQNANHTAKNAMFSAMDCAA